jgi:hypothetical protein
MPFTFAHAAAVLPLARPLGRWGCMSALVIGSMAPDFSYFIPLNIDRDFSHSMRGIIGFGLPAGLIMYLLYHLLMKQPLVALLPAPHAGKAASVFSLTPLWPRLFIGIVAINILIGACTHVAWDSFTHQADVMVLAIPALQQKLFDLGSYPIHVYKLLQHSSTSLGLLVIGAYLWRKWRVATESPPAFQPLPLGLRLFVLCLLVLLPLGLGLYQGLLAFNSNDVWGLRRFVGASLFTALPTFFLALLAYCIAWRAWRVLWGCKNP